MPTAKKAAGSSTVKKAAVKKTAVKKAVAKKTAVKKTVAKKTAAPRVRKTAVASDKFAFPRSFEDEIQIPSSLLRPAPTPMTGRVLPSSFVNQLESAQYAKTAGKFKKSTGKNNRLGLVAAFAATILISSGATYFITKPAPVQFSEQTTDQAKISGGVVLSEAELKAQVKKLGATVYWAGPMKNAKYTLNASNSKEVYVRYLPDGKGVSDIRKQYRVIATYAVTGAFAATAAAGNQSNGVTLSRADGAVVYYNKLEPTNVYLAQKDSNYQVEVFDPEATTSLQLATTLKTVIPIL